jgi:5-methylcytosine-specific restriction endonuclease McrA
MMTTGGATRYRTATYEQHLRSDVWKSTRRNILARDGYLCCRCGGIATEVHHRTYERLGHERDEDLESLCPPCHQKADQERASVSARRARRALYEARLDGWATKRYGEDWDAHSDTREIEEEFDDWLASRDDW